MNKLALQQAWERFHRAQAAHERLAKATVPTEIDRYWSEFLLAASTVYVKLQKGAKGHPKAEPWFGGIKHVRRTDPLLSYVHQARNADEHGLQFLTEKRPHAIKISSVGDGPMVFAGLKIDENGVAHPHPENRGNMKVEMKFSIRLVPVHNDEYGDTFDVPTQHLGQPLPNFFPETLSGLTLQYLRGVLQDAGEFIA